MYNIEQSMTSFRKLCDWPTWPFLGKNFPFPFFVHFLVRFMWIMGFCIPFSVRSATRKKVKLIPALWNIFVRSVKLFVLGFVWGNAGWINFARVRIPGVLQRFAVTYGIVATVATLTDRCMGKRSDGEQEKKDIEMKEDQPGNNNKEGEKVNID